MVKCLDDNIGKLMAHLKEKHIDENTIVVFTSGKLNFPLLSLIRYPLIAKYHYLTLMECIAANTFLQTMEIS